ncbi:hypothetical protein Smp_191070 [Schistosoma mansoni]|uniref:hypothetical protein n=1 Tax=Schistosoma mansoni TaxID=6183 RepID=UPI00019B389D|nr:hypothetical protein Smp_191070 [Schistosoma mansoni]|eukprot:XP_018644099.1 hypothetical protein Smp_191070 [Schistosoma mansoni]
MCVRHKLAYIAHDVSRTLQSLHLKVLSARRRQSVFQLSWETERSQAARDPRR